MPVHSVHHDTVQTEAALSNLMAAPNSMLTASIPPVMVEVTRNLIGVERRHFKMLNWKKKHLFSSDLSSQQEINFLQDNYCFVVDGERVRMGDILGDDQWWRHTSRPTKYFYSEDLRQFHRVNCITAKGKVIAAKLATTGNTIQVGLFPNSWRSSARLRHFRAVKLVTR